MRILLSIVIALAACGSSNSQRRNVPDAFEAEREWEVAPGKFVELNFDVSAATLVAGTPIDPIEVVFQASQPLAWNIHEHPDGGVVILVEGRDAGGVIRHTPTHPGPVSILWENKSSETITATIRLDGMPDGASVAWAP